MCWIGRGSLLLHTRLRHFGECECAGYRLVLCLVTCEGRDATGRVVNDFGTPLHMHAARPARCALLSSCPPVIGTSGQSAIMFYDSNGPPAPQVIGLGDFQILGVKCLISLTK